ncbi:hypothetical protein [Enterobacter hormaechei]|uniref:hypothetical protein n=1 Tax=Enterobacter TaxID=547 RepID=UPI00207C6B41|nr:hypothetical protein [Enterobacter hormaechei]EJD7030465.1 hypothetical protein [Enterobacter hormaechei]EKK5925892.1 hypothetical protein [Enterobacter hormaechei]MCO0822178.1 hypothetical protein [Enterobacter hormaechei]
MENNFFAKIIYVNDDFTQFVINKGYNDDIRYKERFLIVALGEDIIDPDTNENFGRLEIVKGEAVVHHIQEKMTTLISNQFTEEPAKEETIYKSEAISRARTVFGIPNFDRMPSKKVKIDAEKRIKPLLNVRKGDYVKII